MRAGVLGLALLAAVATAAPAAPAPAAPAPAGRAAAGSGALSPTVEERRLDRAPREILRRSGFDDVSLDFARALDRARSVPQARKAVLRHGGALWRRAVDRAQGRGPAGGDLSRDDGRRPGSGS